MRWRARRLAGVLVAPLVLAGTMTVSPAAAADCTSWNGSQPASPGNDATSLDGVAMVSSCDVWAVGWTGQAQLFEHWDGSSWAATTMPSPGPGSHPFFGGMSAVSASDIWAVGGTDYLDYADARAQILHYDGSSWTGAPTSSLGGDSAVLTAVDAQSATDAWAAGLRWSGGDIHPVAVHWDGSSWTPQAVPDPSGIPDPLLVGVSVVSASDAWAVGHDLGTYGSFLERWDGSHWNQVSIPGLSPNDRLNAVSAVSADDVWIVGTDLGTHQALVLHWDGTTWTQQATPRPGGSQWNELSTVTATSAGDVWATGYYTDPAGNNISQLLHGDGSSWTQVTAPGQGPRTVLFAVGATASGQAWVAGSDQHAAFAAPVPVVPNVIGGTVPAAQAALESAGLHASPNATSQCDPSQDGLVLNTAPDPGTLDFIGRPVAVLYCHPYVTVPSVLSFDDASARRAITSAGLTVGSVTMVASCSVLRGGVVTQNPADGTMVLRGSAVSLQESTGKQPNGRPCVIS